MSKIKTAIKMRVTPEQSQKVQEICFENGIKWLKSTEIKHLDKPFIYINLSKYLGYSDDDKYFDEDDNEEVSAELFIKTNGTCVESETPIEYNNKGKQMEELKLECLVEGYEGTYFEVGQVWETRNGNRLRVTGFDFKTDIYKLTMSKVEDLDEEYYYSQRGEDEQGRESDLDLVKLILTETPTESTPSEELQPKTFSEYLKENKAYESFVENYVKAFLKDLAWYKVFKSENKIISLGNGFFWELSNEGNKYWRDLFTNIPSNLIYDMNEIIFAEVDKRIVEQKSSTKYMVFVEGRSNPKKIHDSYDSAEKEARRLSAKEIGCNVFVVSVVTTFKSKVIVEEIK